MKRYFFMLIVIVAILNLAGCSQEKTVSKEGASLKEEVSQKETENLQIIKPLKGTTLTNTHTLENDIKFTTTYDTGDYDLSKWRITDSKVINMNAKVTNVPEGTTILIEQIKLKSSLKAKEVQLNDFVQYYMEDSYNGTSQDGFYINEEYSYQSLFTINGFSKELLDQWEFVSESYGSISYSKETLNEYNIISFGEVYANKIQVIYDVLIKNKNEDLYHIVSLSDEFIIPVGKTKVGKSNK